MEDDRNQWDDVRKRMAEGVEAVLCFDFGLVGEELTRYTSAVLDDVVLPEFEKAAWRVGDVDVFRDQWKDVRKRIAESLEAILCSASGLNGEKVVGYMSFMLDDVFLCEFESAAGCELPKSWCVMERGSNGSIIVGSGLTDAEAVALAKQLISEKGFGKHLIQREF